MRVDNDNRNQDQKRDNFAGIQRNHEVNHNFSGEKWNW